MLRGTSKAQRAWRLSLGAVVLYTVAAMCWLLLRTGRSDGQVFYSTPDDGDAPVCRKSHTGLDVVIACCKRERLRETYALLQPYIYLVDNVHVYSKCGEGDLRPFWSELRSCFESRLIMYNLTNVGREGHTFAFHISKHWDNLAEYTVFLQDSPAEHF